MKMKFFTVAALAALATSFAHATDYYCEADCYSGRVNIKISASSDTEAARIISDNPNIIEQACQSAHNIKATQSSMRSGQCYRERRNSNPTVRFN